MAVFLFNRPYPIPHTPYPIPHTRFMDSDLTPVGIYNFRNQHKTFGIKVDDRRRHIYVVGKTGVGKSTLLENMIIADIRSGKGVGVVDPHGELAEKILDFIPEERLDDVIYFDPSDMDYPIAFNPMEQVGNEFRHLVASGIMGVFKKIWPDAWSARMEYILNNTLLALLELPDATLLGILRMFAEPEYRKKIVDNLKDPVIKAFWANEFARYSQKLETEALAAIQNKVGQFVSNPLIRNILGQPRSALNMRQIMDTGKIFIVNLSKGKIGEDNSALLGAMIITRLNLAAMSRVDIAERDRRDFFLYVDEFQNFATDSFASILSEARKYHLSLTLAHQYIGQLTTSDSTKVRDAIFGNVGTIVTFRVGAEDGEFLEKEFMPEFLQTDLVNLAKANIYIKLMVDGIATRPFSAETIPPQPTPLNSYRDVIIKNSRERYGTPKAVVESRIAGEWLAKSDVAINDKIDRQGERRLSEVLRPAAGMAMRPGMSRTSPPASRPMQPPYAPVSTRLPVAPAAASSMPSPASAAPSQNLPPQRRMEDVQRQGPSEGQRLQPSPQLRYEGNRPVIRPSSRPEIRIDPRPEIKKPFERPAGGSREEFLIENENLPTPTTRGASSSDGVRRLETEVIAKGSDAPQKSVPVTASRIVTNAESISSTTVGAASVVQNVAREVAPMRSAPQSRPPTNVRPPEQTTYREDVRPATDSGMRREPAASESMARAKPNEARGDGSRGLSLSALRDGGAGPRKEDMRKPVDAIHGQDAAEMGSADAVVPKKVIRPNVDIEGLRRAINESLRKQNEINAAANPAAQVQRSSAPMAHGENASSSPVRTVRLSVPANEDTDAKQQVNQELAKMETEPNLQEDSGLGDDTRFMQDARLKINQSLARQEFHNSRSTVRPAVRPASPVSQVPPAKPHHRPDAITSG